MHWCNWFGIFVTSVSALHAQSVNIRGKVSNPSGQAVNGAIVELERQGLKDTTAADGRYSLIAGAMAARRLSSAPGLSSEADVLRLTLDGPVAVTIQGTDVQGRSVIRHQSAAFPSGDATESVGVRLGKAAAAVDTLKVTATGYRTQRVPVASWDTTTDIVLQTGNPSEKNPPVRSAGCGKSLAMTNGKKSITSGGEERTYIIDIPPNYDPNKPYRLFYCSHWIGSTSEAVRDQNYYFLKPLATAANDPAIFIAPQSQGSTWQQKDHPLFDALLAMAKENLCIDETRVFATGFSFGGMITYSLSTNHQKQIRAAVGIGPANYNIWIPNPKLKDPIAWMQTTGMGDGTTPWVNGNSSTQGAKYIALEKAADNGCTLPADIPTTNQGAHVCYDFQGCKAGYPVKACTFNGGHTNIANDPGSSGNWIPQESWKFFTQF